MIPTAYRPIIGLLMLCLFSCSGPVESGVLAPPIATNTVSGNEFDLSSLEGKYVLIDFWASWCGPCHKDAPHLVELYTDYSQRSFHDADGFEVVSIALEKKDNGNWKKVADKFGFNWPIQIVEEAAYVRFSEFGSAYGVTDIPAKFLISPQGNIVMGPSSITDIKSALDAASN